MKRFFTTIGLYINRVVLVSFLLLLPTAFLCTFFFSNPNFIKKTLRESRVYTYVSETLVTQTSVAFASTAGSYGLSNEAVTQAAKKALPASDLQVKTEKNIDEAYSWLYGEKPSYTPHIDLRENQTIFMQEIANVSTSQTIYKPECTTDQLLQITAERGGQAPVITELPCRASGTDPAILQAQLFEGLRSSMIAPSVNPPASQEVSNSLMSPEITSATEVTNTLVPTVFRVMSISFYLSLVGIMLCVGIYHLLYKKSLVHTVIALAKPLLTSGILLIVYGVFSWWIISQNIFGKIVGQNSNNDVLQSSIRPFADLTLITALSFGGIYIVCAAILFYLHRRLRAGQNANDTPQPPQPSIQTSEPPMSSTFHSSQTKV